MNQCYKLILASLFFITVSTPAHSAEPSFTVKLLTPETALKAAQAGLNQCRAIGYQVTIVVVDRAGQVQVMLRDRYAGEHTIEAAMNKAWTAASFKISTTELAKNTQSGNESSGIRDMSRVLAIGGGMTVDIGGTVYGAIGVSGAPSGTEDDKCAEAAIAAIAVDLEFD
jgi:uncharacterized protein GlcG (DUF336 family)